MSLGYSLDAYAYSAASNKLNTNYTLSGNGAEDIYAVAKAPVSYTHLDVYKRQIFGGKWKSRIICVLAANEKLRYSELRREMCNITDAVLAATLKDLIEDGIIDRKSYDEIPPRVEYMLTQKGKSVVPILQNICQWSGVFYKEDVKNEMMQCQKCDHHR